MRQVVDVVIVGARCTGAALATMLSRQGVTVALLESGVDVDHDNKPAQAVQSDTFRFLDDLGVIDDVRRVSGPFLNRVVGRFGDHRFTAPYPLRHDDHGGAAFVRRYQLDPILLDAARQAGAQVHMGTKVHELLRDDQGRVIGVRASDGDGRVCEIRARLVIGADGRTSTVARLTGSRKYHATMGQRAYFWGYFEGARASSDPAFLVQVWDDKFHWGGPVGDDLFMMGVSFDVARLQEFRTDIEESYLAEVRACPAAAELLDGAELVGRPSCVIRFEGYFREASGPGWALVGDAGHFKDPVAGRGVGDAFMQVGSVAPAIVGGLGSSDKALDRAMARWGRQRDRMFAPHYWLSVDMASESPLARTVVQVMRQIHQEDDDGSFLELLSHRRRPSQVMTVRRMVRASTHLLTRPEADRRALGAELVALARAEVSRRRARRNPSFGGYRQQEPASGEAPVEHQPLRVG